MKGHARRWQIYLLSYVLMMSAVSTALGEFGVHVKYERTPLREKIARIKNYIKDGGLEHFTFTCQAHEGLPQTITRHATLKLRKDAPATLLLCHGYMCNKNDTAFLRQYLFKDYNVMTFDFRAHGQGAQNQWCTFGADEALDVIGAVKYLRSRPETQDTPIIGYGFSMGAVASIEAQAKQPVFDAMIVDCPYDTSENIIGKGLECMKCSVFGYEFDLPGKSILQRYAFHPYVQSMLKSILRTIAQWDDRCTNTIIVPVCPVESIKKITVPMLIIHCKNDKKIPASCGRALFDAKPGYKRLWLTNGRRHFDSFFYNPEKYRYKVKKFVKKFLNGELQDGSGKISQDPDD